MPRGASATKAAFRFGFATDTYDADGTPAGPDTAPQLDRAELERLAAQAHRTLPADAAAFSAKKIHGRPAHELARRKQPVELKPVEIEVFEFRLLGMEGSVGAVCRRMRLGHVHPRAGARDGHRSRLRRAHGGNHAHGRRRIHAGSGHQSGRIREALVRAGKAADWILPLGRLLPELPRVNVLPIVEHRVRHGSKFQISLSQIQPGRVEVPQGATAQLDSGEWKPGRLRVFNQQDQLIAIAEAVVPRTYQPVLVLDAEP